MEPGSPTLGAWSLSHWTPREVPHHTLFCYAQVQELTLISWATESLFNVSHSWLWGWKISWLKSFDYVHYFCLNNLLVCATRGSKLSLCIRVRWRVRKSQSHHLAWSKLAEDKSHHWGPMTKKDRTGEWRFISADEPCSGEKHRTTSQGEALPHWKGTSTDGCLFCAIKRIMTSLVA